MIPDKVLIGSCAGLGQAAKQLETACMHVGKIDKVHNIGAILMTNINLCLSFLTSLVLLLLFLLNNNNNYFYYHCHNYLIIIIINCYYDFKLVKIIWPT